MPTALRSRIRHRLSSRVGGIKLLLRLGKISKGDYYDLLSGLVFQRVLTPASNCIDVGFHHGDVLEAMMKYAPRGFFLALEPVPLLYEGIKKRFRGSFGLELLNLALSEKAGKENFTYYPESPAFSGFKATIETGMGVDLEVDIEPLDQLVDYPVRLVKIDVEGAELQ